MNAAPQLDLMPQQWFEMGEIRRRRFNNAVWIPLRGSRYLERSGESGRLGFKEEYEGVNTFAAAISQKALVEQMDWHSLSRSNHLPHVEHGAYVPADAFYIEADEPMGLSLVLSQPGNEIEAPEWYLHQDLVLALGLRREKNSWIAIDEGYCEVARLVQTDDISLLEIRSSHLKDYLCARNLILHVSCYRERAQIVGAATHIAWSQGHSVKDELDKWQGNVTAIHEGGIHFGSSTLVMHIGRTDNYEGEDVPKVGPSDQNITWQSQTQEFSGRKLFRIEGRLWRREWVTQGERSVRVRGDKPAEPVFFIVDASGKRRPSETIEDDGRWLWFSPDVITRLAHRRGGALTWFTRDTGSVRCSPDSGVHFGMNTLGMVNAYAKDIALLPYWQQLLWQGSNITPEGGVSRELLDAQAMGSPAKTLSPEREIPKLISAINELTAKRFGVRIFRVHADMADIMSRSHRFRSLDLPGFLALAKDLARLTADGLDTSALHKIAPPGPSVRLASLKSLQLVIEKYSDSIEANNIMTPLFGIYDLRLADAHLTSHDLDSALTNIGIDQSSPFVLRGYQMLRSLAFTLFEIGKRISDATSSG